MKERRDGRVADPSGSSGRKVLGVFTEGRKAFEKPRPDRGVVNESKRVTKLS